MNLKKTTFELLYKPYSMDIKGYILRIADLIYIVINSHLSKTEAEKTENTLKELSTNHPHKLILLKGDGQVCKTDNLDILERAC